MDEHGGEFPRTRSEAEALPGVGAYTAGAVLSIAYGLHEPLIDGNVQRVLARWFAVEGVVTKAAQRRLLDRAAGELVQGVDDPGAWNQALMELGATVCIPRSPNCPDCPVSGECRALAEGTQKSRPISKRRPRVPTVFYDALVMVSRGGELLMVRRPTDGLLGGLWEFPCVERHREGRAGKEDRGGKTDRAGKGSAVGDTRVLDDQCRACLEDLAVRPPTDPVHSSVLPVVRHAFTHFKAVYSPTLFLYTESQDKEAIRPPRIELHDGAVRWVAPNEIEKLPLPVAQRRIFELAVAARVERAQFGAGCSGGLA